MAGPDKVIGIDFGTTKSVAAILEGTSPRPIRDRSGRRYVPSLVLVTPDGELAAGWEAQNHPRRYESEYITINSIKRSVGRQGETGWGWWKTRPQEVAALILGRLKLEVEACLGQEVSRAVVAIPAHFSFNQRWAVKQAAEIAGFNVTRLLNEATAGALRYGFCQPAAKDQKILVFDFGGGTLDVSVLQIGEGVYEVEATVGDDRLGGDDFDHVILNYVLEQLRQLVSTSLELATGQLTVLREAATRAKVDLSGSSEARIYLPGFLNASRGAWHDVDVTISRETFRTLSADLLARVEPLLQRVLKQAEVRASGLEGVLLIGGTSRMPSVQEVVRKVLGPRTRIGVDPESGVAEGAAIQAAVWEGRVKDMLLLDAAPSSLGVETAGGVFTKLINTNTTIPTKKSEIFSTTTDNQSTVTLRIFQGEHEMAANNEFVGQLELTSIPPAPRGVPQIEVTFDIDASGIEHVSVRDIATKREVSMQLIAPFRLTPAQMRTMQRACAGELSKIQERLACESEGRRLEELRGEAERLVKAIDRVLSGTPRRFLDSEVSILVEAKRLVGDYLERGASASDLARLLEGIRLELSRIWGKGLARVAERLTGDVRFTGWAAQAVQSMSDGQSMSQLMGQLKTELASSIEAILGELELAADVAGAIGWSRGRAKEEVCKQALGALEAAPGAKCCLGLILSHFDSEVLFDLESWLPSRWDESLAVSLGILMLVRELDHQKSLPRRRVGAKALDTLLASLPARASAEQKAILGLLAGVGEHGPINTEGLVRFVESSANIDVRCAAVATLQKVGGPDAVLPLLGLAGHDDSRIRQVARQALERCDDTTLWFGFENHPSAEAWRGLLHLSPRLLRAWASSPPSFQERRRMLVATLPSADPKDQRFIIQSLAGLPLADQANLGPLLAVVETAPDPEVRVAVITILALFYDQRIIAPLLRLTRDRDAAVRTRAREALDHCRRRLGPRVARLIRLTVDASKRRPFRDRFFLWRMARRNPGLRQTLAMLEREEANVDR
jgi:molecular chaperone DnaK